MRCSQARRRILASRDARLALADRLELDTHLQVCTVCRALDAADADLEEALAALPEPPVERVDVEAAVRAVRVRIDEGERERAAERTRRVRAGKQIGWAAAAAAAIALGAWALLARDGSSPKRPNEVVEREHPEPVETVESTTRFAESASASEGRYSDANELEASEASELAHAPSASESSAVPQETPLGSSAEPQEAPIESSAIASEASFDVERHDRARAAVRETFAQATAAHAGSGEDPAVLAARLQALEAPLNNLANEGWNVTALAERVVADADAEVAGLAARWLGPKSDRLAIRTIAGVLRRPDAPATLRRQATLALLDDGEQGIDVLGPALLDAQLRPLALERLLERGGAAPVSAVAKALEAARTDDAVAAELAHALAQLGSPGVDALIDAVGHGGSAAEAALAELRRTRGAPERLAAQLGERAPARQLDVRVEAAARLGLPEVLPVLRERALDRARRDTALALLGAFEGRGALAIALELWSSSRFGEDELRLAARAILARDPREGVALVDALEEAQSAGSLHDLLDLTLVCESQSAAATLARLVASPWLASDERQWAALALAELGTDSELRSLAEALRDLEPADARLAAACALALHALGGPSALREAMEVAGATTAERLIALLESRPSDRNQAATISRAARLLEPWLDSRTPQRPRTTP